MTLSTKDSAKLLEQLKSGFKPTINWNKYQLKGTVQTQNQYLDYLIDLSLQGVNRLENIAYWKSYARYFLNFRNKRLQR